MPFRKGEQTEALRAAVDEAIEQLREDGTLSELSRKYVGSDRSRDVS